MFNGSAVNVVIPALNEAEALPKTLAAIPRWVDRVIVADNGSTDATAEVARAGGAHVVSEPRRGYGFACLAALAVMPGCDVVVFLDADFSDDPRCMKKLVEPIVADRADMVIGSRATGEAEAGSMTFVQRFGNELACRLIEAMWRRRYTDLGPFRAIRARSLRQLAMADTNYGWTIEMQIKAIRAGLRVAEVPVGYRRRIGQSKISGTITGAARAGAKILWTIFRYALSPPPAGGGDRLIVLSRYPLPGETKTRLIPAIGAVNAARCQQRMTEHAVTVAKAAAGEVEFRYAGGTAAKVRRWLGGTVIAKAQGPGDLGRRLDRSFGEAFADGCARVVLIGADTPGVTAPILAEAAAALDDHDVVLGPADDGGYYLIGLRQPAGLVDRIAWSTSTVLAETTARAREAGLSIRMLDRLSDVDLPGDFDRLPTALKPTGPYVSVIIPALNEAARIGAAIRSAQTDGAEVIVVDGGSADPTASLAAAAGARVIRSPRGRATQMNAGAAIATGEVLLFLHADTTLPTGYLVEVFQTMFDRRVVAGAFGFDTDLPGLAMGLIRRLVRFRSENMGMPYGDQALFVRRTAFDAIGGFPDMPVAEDLEFIRRVKRIGRIAIAPSTAVTSGRRWAGFGAARTTVVNQMVVVGHLLGVSPDRPAKWYRSGHGT